jgi:hypothetical protein
MLQCLHQLLTVWCYLCTCSSRQQSHPARTRPGFALMLCLVLLNCLFMQCAELPHERHERWVALQAGNGILHSTAQLCPVAAQQLAAWSRKLCRVGCQRQCWWLAGCSVHLQHSCRNLVLGLPDC